MNYKQMVAGMTPELYRRFKTAVELGKWPDGRALSEEQRQNALQAVILWDRLHAREEQPVGEIDRGRKARDKLQNGSATQPVTFVETPEEGKR